MSSQSPDTGWFPKPRPKPVKEVSTPKVIFGTLVPAVLVIGIAILIVSQGRGHSATTVKSPAAFEACLVAHGITPAVAQQAYQASRTGAVDPNADKEQQALRACRNTLPDGTSVSSFSSGGDSQAQQQFAECVQNAGVGRSRGSGGRFGRSGPSEAFRKAVEVCRNLAQSGAGAGAGTGTTGGAGTTTLPQTQTPPATGTPPVA